jgi:hypothetical protein
MAVGVGVMPNSQKSGQDQSLQPAKHSNQHDGALNSPKLWMRRWADAQGWRLKKKAITKIVEVFFESLKKTPQKTKTTQKGRFV